MKLRSFSYFLGLLIIFFHSSIGSEEKIDIWKNNKKAPLENNQNKIDKNEKELNLNTSQSIKNLEKIEIEEGSMIGSDEKKVYGIYEPANYNFDLNMWSSTKADDLRSSLKRLNKIKLSKTSNDILESILFSFSYPPQGMNEKEFVNLKVDWLIKNDRTDLIESFLKRNEQFESKDKLVQYIVDKNIASGNIKEG